LLRDYDADQRAPAERARGFVTKGLRRVSINRFLLIAGLLQVVWGLVPNASGFILGEIPVELYVAIRWAISGSIFAIYLACIGGWKKIGLGDFAAVSLLGIVGYGIASLIGLHGMKLGGVANFALVGSLSPIITAVAAIWILRERPTRLFFLALPACALGLLFLVFGKYQASSASVAGASALLVLGGYACEALVFVCSKKFKGRMSAAQYLAIAQIAAAAFAWLLQGLAFHQVGQLARLSTRGLAAAAFVSVVSCVLCYAVLYWLLNHIDAHRLALFDGLHTLSATIFAYFIFNEPIRPFMLFGGALILSGLIAGNWPKVEWARRSAPREARSAPPRPRGRPGVASRAPELEA
jgi:drug/metabolite transporter (DMT)-like permease